ncbi:YfhO family protein [Paracrocinitomix mangrovi]|uniref:YfhO family protein n=1 Tax=Paracrocinitomix mangrovi TaxID=2862509 RepID=UPI001C8DC587|nr:YfhO family protein [Paracrocinitomix mangrovi]UKN02786.1 YfhO family protein [Paracrocinitomix mangrovi]
MNRLKEIFFQKSNLWHLGAVGLFLIIAIAFAHPAFKGYSVNQGDVTNYIGMSQEIKDYADSDGQIGWTNAMFSGMPSTQINMDYGGSDIPQFLRSAFKLWLPRPVSFLFIYFLGFYLLALSLKVKPYFAAIAAIAFGLSSYQIIIIEAGHITKALAIGFSPLILAGMFYAYRWKNWILGIGLSSLFMTWELMSNHLQITYYMIFVMLGVGIVELIRYLKKEDGVKKFLKITAGLIVAYVIAALVNIGNIMGTQEYMKYTTRGGNDLTISASGEENNEIKTSGLDREYITNWSYGKSETFTFIVPNYKGGETQLIGANKDNEPYLENVENPQYRDFVKNQGNQYWGDQPFTSGPVYLGVIVMFLAFLGLVYSKDKLRWALLAVTILTVMLSWGKNMMWFTDLFIDYVPGYNKFRAVTIILVVAQLCVPLLGVLFFKRLHKEREKIAANLIPFFVVSGLFGVILLAFLAAPTAFNSFLSGAEQKTLDAITDPQLYDQYAVAFGELESVRISIFRGDVVRSLSLFILAFGLLFIYIKGILKNVFAFAGILAVLVLVDMWMVDKRYLNTEKRGRNYTQWVETWKQQYPYTAGAGDMEIFNREAQRNPELLFRVDSTINAQSFDGMEPGEVKRVKDWMRFRVLNRNTNFRVLDMGNAFNSTYVSYFHKSIGGYHGAKLSRYQDLIEFHIGKGNPSVLDMLNMKYQVYAGRDNTGNQTCQFVRENYTAMGNAWFAKEINIVATADDEILALEASNSARIKPGSAEFQVLINHEPLVNAVEITGNELVEVVYPIRLEDGTISTDTMQQNIPIKEAEAADLSLIPPSEASPAWNWAYDARLDSSYIRVMTVTTSDRQGFVPWETTVVNEEFKNVVTQDSYSGSGTIEMTNYSPDKITYKSSSDDKQLAVFSEIYYPLGWTATIDGNEVPIARVNYVLRAVEVPAGDHVVELVYNIPHKSTFYTLALTGSILMILIIGFGIYLETKNTAAEEDESAE